MIPAEQWDKEGKCFAGVAREIQLDAFKAGMTRAAEMVDCQRIHSDFSLHSVNGPRLMVIKIELYRDNLKELPV
jgi:hypothetical protein